MAGTVPPPIGSSKLFDFSSTPGDGSLSSVWPAQAASFSGPSQPLWLSDTQQHSPASGGSLFRGPGRVGMGGAEDKIRQSMAALNDVITPHTPGSLLKERFRAGLTSQIETPHAGRTSHTGTPHTVSLSIMDEKGFTRELLLSEETEETAVDTTFLTTSAVGQGQRHTSDDPAEKTSRELVTLFHRSYSTHSSPAQSLELVAELQAACEDQIKAVKLTYSSQTQLLAELTLERNTWELINVLYTDRLEEGALEEEDMDTLALTGQSHKEIADEYFIKDSTVRQAQVVVDWLEKNSASLLEKYPTKVSYFADSVCWENTLYSILRKEHSEGVVTEMDPDAPCRQDKHLADLDEKDEQSLLKHLFTCVRAGEVAKAQELCVQCGQAWRAATLEGWRLHHDPNQGKSLLVDDIEAVEGNVSRSLWKVCAWRLAADTKLNVYERALYAGLSGNVKQILPACNSWLDYVWAYLKVMVDVLTERRLRGSSSSGLPLESLPSDYWNSIVVPELIFQEIEACPNAMINKQSKNPFHVVQKFVVLGNLEGLVSVMHEWLQEQPNLYQLRFMAHLVLFAQGLTRALAEDDRCSDILQTYVKSLIEEKFHKCVALYTSRLPRPLQVTSYASLLEGIVDPEEQRECLELGSEVGLDIAVVTKSVVEHMRNTGPEEGVPMLGPELAPQMDTEITKLDKSKIEVIRWLIFDKGQRSEAIRQGNALMRQFLATRKLSAADALFRKLPSDSVEVVTRAWKAKAGDSPLPADLANDIHEHRCIQAYLECHVTFNEWFHHFHHSKPDPPPEPSYSGFKDNVEYEYKLKQYENNEQAWQNQLISLSEEAENCLYRVLLFEGGWMVDPEQSEEEDERRARQLVLLREICVPQVTILLHTILDATRQTKKCLQLADIIAAENHQLYKVFRQHELERLLSLLHKTATAALGQASWDTLFA